MAKTQIIESFITQGQILEQESINNAILCRAKYQICAIGEKNRNNRVYEKSVWEKVLADQEIQDKLKNKALFFHAEHPTTTQSNTEKVAGVVTNITLNEGENKVYATMEVLDTPYGRIVDTLLRAGCGIGVSTRADGELEEALDEAGQKYQRVVPESYRFVTIDFTADPSTFGSELPLAVERDVTNVIKGGLDDSKLDKDFATVLLETMHSPEAIALLESIKNDKHHVDCGCKASEKKCTKGCPKAIDEKVLTKAIIKKLVDGIEQDKVALKSPTMREVIGKLSEKGYELNHKDIKLLKDTLKEMGWMKESVNEKKDPKNKSYIIPAEVMEDSKAGNDTAVADYLSDKYGTAVKNLKVMQGSAGTGVVYDVEWDADESKIHEDINANISPELQKELDDYEFHIESDIGEPPMVDGKEDWKQAKSYFWIETPNDPSVGIFPQSVSPSFESIDELIVWWNLHKTEIMALEDEFINDKITPTEYNAKLKQIIGEAVDPNLPHLEGTCKICGKPSKIAGDRGEEYCSTECQQKDYSTQGEFKKVNVTKESLGIDESILEVIKKVDGKWQVQSHKGRNMGTYDTEEEAKKRLGQIEYFKHQNEKTGHMVGKYIKIFGQGKKQLDAINLQKWCADHGLTFMDLFRADPMKVLELIIKPEYPEAVGWEIPMETEWEDGEPTIPGIKTDEKYTTSSDKSGQPANAKAAAKVAKKSAAKNKIRITEAHEVYCPSCDKMTTKFKQAKNEKGEDDVQCLECGTFIYDEYEQQKKNKTNEAKGPCRCGSGKESYWLYDAKQIPVGRVCPDCVDQVKKKYRPEIFTGYTQADVNEPIEADESKLIERGESMGDLSSLSDAEIVSRYRALAKEQNKQEDIKGAENLMKEIMKRGIEDKIMEIGESLEPKVKQFLTDNWGTFKNETDALNNLVQVFKIGESDAKKYIELVEKDKGKISAVSAMVNEKGLPSGTSKDMLGEMSLRLVSLTAERNQLVENYGKDAVVFTKKIDELNQQLEVAKIKESDYYKCTAENAKTINDLKEQLVKADENIKNLKESSDKSIKTIQEERSADVKRITEEKQTEIEQLKEAHRKDLIKFYVTTKIKSMGLSLPESVLTLLESCKSVDEVDAQIRKTQNALRETLVQSAGGLSEIVVEPFSEPNPALADIRNKVSIALKHFGI